MLLVLSLQKSSKFCLSPYLTECENNYNKIRATRLARCQCLGIVCIWDKGYKEEFYDKLFLCLFEYFICCLVFTTNFQYILNFYINLYRSTLEIKYITCPKIITINREAFQCLLLKVIDWITLIPRFIQRLEWR